MSIIAIIIFTINCPKIVANIAAFGITPKKAINMKITVSISWDTQVEALFLNQRCFSLVTLFQKWKAQTSWCWLIKYAINPPKTILPTSPKVCPYASCPCQNGAEGNFIATHTRIRVIIVVKNLNF